jgi:thiol:disulfide interchange protein
MKSAALSRWFFFIALLLAGPVAAKPASPRPIAWSQQEVIAARNAGKTVFVAFRADWCITCRVNEVTVFRARKVRAALAAPNVVYMVADYTGKNDPAMKQALEYYQAGVLPLYLVFHPDRRRPQVLPQNLGPKDLLQSLHK